MQGRLSVDLRVVGPAQEVINGTFQIIRDLCEIQGRYIGSIADFGDSIDAQSAVRQDPSQGFPLFFGPFSDPVCNFFLIVHKFLLISPK